MYLIASQYDPCRLAQPRLSYGLPKTPDIIRRVALRSISDVHGTPCHHWQRLAYETGTAGRRALLCRDTQKSVTRQMFRVKQSIESCKKKALDVKRHHPTTCPIPCCVSPLYTSATRNTTVKSNSTGHHVLVSSRPQDIANHLLCSCSPGSAAYRLLLGGWPHIHLTTTLATTAITLIKTAKSAILFAVTA